MSKCQPACSLSNALFLLPADLRFSQGFCSGEWVHLVSHSGDAGLQSTIQNQAAAGDKNVLSLLEGLWLNVGLVLHAHASDHHLVHPVELFEVFALCYSLE